MTNAELISAVRMQDRSDIFQCVKEGFQLIGTPNFRATDVVAIKPNLCCIKGPETGATTDVRVVEGIIKYLQEEFQIHEILVVESDGTQVLADMAFKLLGYERLSRRLNVKLINLSKTPCSTKTFLENASVKKVEYPNILENVNWLVSVPKIKMHTLCSLGATMKNQFGCNPFQKKSIYHKDLNTCIVDLNYIFKPQLIVVDGIVAMEGRGPVSGLPVAMNTLLFGRDAVAMDHFIARTIGMNPGAVKYLVEARKRGLGTADYKTVGAGLEDVEKKFKGIPCRRNLYGMFS